MTIPDTTLLLTEQAMEGGRPVMPGATKIVAMKEPAVAREIARRYLDKASKCSPDDLRKKGVQGGNKELCTLIGDVRAELKGADHARHAPVAAVEVAPAAPEFARLHEAVRHATSSFSARVHAEAQEHGAHATARVKQAADVATSKLMEELQEACEDSTALAAALEDAEARAASSAQTCAQLQSRIDDLQSSQRPLIGAAEDLRATLRRKDQEQLSMSSDVTRLQGLLAQSDVRVAAADIANRELRHVIRANEREVGLLNVTLEARTMEVAAFQASLDTLVNTNAVLAARRAPSARSAPMSSPSSRRDKGRGKAASPQS